MYKCFQGIPIEARQYAAGFEYKPWLDTKVMPRDDEGYCPWGRIFKYMGIVAPTVPLPMDIAYKLGRKETDIMRFTEAFDYGKITNLRRALGVR